MFINPDDRRLGNRRQQMTRAKIAAITENEQKRRRGMSRFAQTGQDRLARARRPFRASSSGGRMADARQGGGRASFLGARVPGNPNARRYIEPDMVRPPRIQPPTPPGRLPGDSTRETLDPALLDFLRDQNSPQNPVGGDWLDQLRGGPQSLNPILPPDQLGDMMGGPTSPVSSGLDLSQMAGLIPLGGGTWFDPNTGMLHGLPAGGGAGGQQFKAI